MDVFYGWILPITAGIITGIILTYIMLYFYIRRRVAHKFGGAL